MTITFVSRQLPRIRGVRKADKATNRMSFSGVVPWFDIGNPMGPSRRDGSSFEGVIEVESLLEHDFVVGARFDGITREIRSQPCKLRWFDPRMRSWRMHTPDFELVQRGQDRLLYVQVKPKRIADYLAAEHALIRRSFAMLGHRFEVWTEDEIRKQPRFRNCEMLFGHTAPIENVAALDRIREVLRLVRSDTPTVGQIRRAAGVGGATLPALLRLHVRGEIRFDLDREIDERALVHRAA